MRQALRDTFAILALLAACGDSGSAGTATSTNGETTGSTAAPTSSTASPSTGGPGTTGEPMTTSAETTAPATATSEPATTTTTGDATDSGMTSSTGGEWPNGPPACDAGGQDGNSGGAEEPYGEAVVGLCRMALGCPAIWPLAKPPDAGKMGGTPNHKLLWRVWYYGWAQLMGSPAELDEARTMLLDFFAIQVTGGHYAIGNADEVLNTSHYQIWLSGMTCARLLAVHHDDPEMLASTGLWWRGEMALYDILQRGGSIDAPGARFKDGQAGPTQLRDVVYAMIRGAPLTGNPGNSDSPWWDDYYNVGAWTLRELFKLGDDLGGANDAGPADLPNLHDPLELYTNGDDFVFVFPKLRAALQPLFWVARIGGQTTYAPYIAGTPVDNPFPPPVLPGATLTTIPGSP